MYLTNRGEEVKERDSQIDNVSKETKLSLVIIKEEL
tara:strand:+ start:34 stop:141 length:108 start_codon:yes stop_codon:yes gene_type:complete